MEKYPADYLMGVDELAELLGKDVKTVRNWVYNKKHPFGSQVKVFSPPWGKLNAERRPMLFVRQQVYEYCLGHRRENKRKDT